MQPVAVGRFDHENVARRRRNRIGMERHVEPPDVAAEHEGPRPRLPLDAHLDHPRSQEVAGVVEAGPHAGTQIEPGAVGDGPQPLEGRLRVPGREQRKSRRVLAEPLLVGVVGILLLKLGGVEEQKPRELERGGGAVHGTAKPVAHQARQIAGMIDVRVGQDDVIERGRLERRRAPVELAQLLETLEHPGVDQHAGAVRLDEVARTRHRAGRAVETEMQGHRFFPRPRWRCNRSRASVRIASSFFCCSGLRDGRVSR